MKMHKDKIYIEGLRVDTVIGIWGWERQIKQRIIIDIEFSADAQRITQDNIDETVNYRDVANKIKKFCEEKHCQRFETLAEQVVKILILDFNVEWATVRVTKPGALSDALNVGITVERNKKDYEK